LLDGWRCGVSSNRHNQTTADKEACVHHPEATLTIPLRDSRCLLLAWLGLHIAALAALVLAAVPMWLRVAAVVLVALHGLWGWRRWLRWPAGSRLVWAASGEWLLEMAGKTAVCWTSATATRVQPGVVVLRLEGGEGGRRSVVLCADAVDGDLHRRLRVRLRRPGRAAGGLQPAVRRGT
jgi:hypothetical protein